MKSRLTTFVTLLAVTGFVFGLSGCPKKAEKAPEGTTTEAPAGETTQPQTGGEQNQ